MAILWQSYAGSALGPIMPLNLRIYVSTQWNPAHATRKEKWR